MSTKKREGEDTISNETRAAWAAATVAQYQLVKGEPEGVGNEEAIIDLLTDLRHLCKLEGLHYEKLDNMAFQHFENER